MVKMNFAKPLNGATGDGYGSQSKTHKGIDYPAWAERIREINTVLLCIAVLLLLTCIQIRPTQAATLDEMPVGEGEKREREQLEKFAPFVKREGNTLHLRLKSGADMALINTGECAGWNTCEIFKFLDYFKDVGFFLVDVDYGEPSDKLMISEKNGKEYVVYAIPRFSPDRKRFVAVSASEAFDPAGVFIWRFAGDDLIEELSYEPKGDEYALYEFVKWENDSTIALNKRSIPFPITVPVVLKLDDGVWKFEEILPDEE
ncbi:MAG: hypothetical protein HZB82_01160 [Deltaproteobacteria bacterium]|nr:hypothetical protein [Deltaproteobacteria bacterium]